MIEYGFHELIEDERLRFEKAIAVHMEVSAAQIFALRDGDSYGDRMFIVIAWWAWAVAVGLVTAIPRSTANEHSVVDDHGQPL